MKVYNKIRYGYKLPFEFVLIFLYKKIFGSSKVVKKVLNHEMIVDLNDVGISRKIFFKGIHEPLSTEQYMKEVKEGMNVLEIGSNIGYYALLGSNLIGKSGKVIAFEPNPINFEMLKLNIELNKCSEKFDCYPYGVGSENGELDFYMMNKGNTSSFIHRDDSTIKIEEIKKIKVVKLDDFFDKDIKIDYFRMDVEGYELEIIKGMKNILASNNKPQGCFIEVHSALLNQMNSSAKDFVDMMKDYGFKIKIARYRGLQEHKVTSNQEFNNHKLREIGYWEVFFDLEINNNEK